MLELDVADRKLSHEAIHQVQQVEKAIVSDDPQIGSLPDFVEESCEADDGEVYLFANLLSVLGVDLPDAQQQLFLQR